jgi:hypothetical protein
MYGPPARSVHSQAAPAGEGAAGISKAAAGRTASPTARHPLIVDISSSDEHADGYDQVPGERAPKVLLGKYSGTWPHVVEVFQGHANGANARPGFANSRNSCRPNACNVVESRSERRAHAGRSAGAVTHWRGAGKPWRK